MGWMTRRTIPTFAQQLSVFLITVRLTFPGQRHTLLLYIMFLLNVSILVVRITPFRVHTNNCSLYPIKLTLLKIAKLANTKRPEAASLLSLFFTALSICSPKPLSVFYCNLCKSQV